MQFQMIVMLLQTSCPLLSYPKKIPEYFFKVVTTASFHIIHYSSFTATQEALQDSR
jgi:hypothetical protein